MTEKRTILYGTQQLRTFALHEDKDVLINAAPLRHVFTFYQVGITATKQYWWEIKENIEVEKIFVAFNPGGNPSGKLTLSIHETLFGPAEFEVEFNMSGSIASNAYVADLSNFPPVGDGKYGKLVSTVNANNITVVAHHCHLYNPLPPIQII